MRASEFSNHFLPTQTPESEMEPSADLGDLNDDIATPPWVPQDTCLKLFKSWCALQD